MPLLIFILIAIVIAIIVMPFIAMAKASRAEHRVNDLSFQLGRLEKRLRQLTDSMESSKHAEQPTAATQAIVPPVVVPAQSEPVQNSAVVPAMPSPDAMEATPPAPGVPEPEEWPNAFDEDALHPNTPPPLPTTPLPAESKPAQRPVPSGPAINWEQFMGAKLFAWVGGLALFLGVGFFVKYSFEHNLIPPELRVAIGFIIGIGLLAGGVIMKRRETAVTAQTLCSTGIVILYAVTFACHSFYHFPLFGHTLTFFLMTLITATAFILAVRLDALVVAVLGIAGGFLTPIMLSTGQDAPLALFGYIALLDIGLLAVALHQKWQSLPILGTIGTIAMQIGWVAKFFIPERYSEGHKVLIAMTVFAGFQALFLAANALTRRSKVEGCNFSGSTLALGVVALMASFFFLFFPGIAHQPGLLFVYVFLVDLGLIALAILDERLAAVEALAGFAVFILLGVWTYAYLGSEHLHAALICYLVFALLHFAVPAVMRWMGMKTAPVGVNVLPVLALPFLFLSFPIVAQHPVLLFGSVFLVSAALVALEYLDRESANIQGWAGGAAFLLLGAWTGRWLTNENLYTALGLYFVFALFHSIAPVAIHKLRGKTAPWWCNVFPALSLVLVMIPIFKLAALTFMIWPLVLLLDILAVALAVLTGALLPILAVLLLTLAAAGAWIFKIPAELTGLPTGLFVIGACSVFFIVATMFACRKLAGMNGKKGAWQAGNLFGDTSDPENLAVQIPCMSAALPFLLLIMVTMRLPLANPSPVFGVALLLVVLLLGLARIMSIEALPAIGLVSTLALEHAWHFHDFNPAHATLPLVWYLGFYAAFTVFPFLFHRRFSQSTVPWATAALSGPLHFYLVYNVVRMAWPEVDPVIGLIPAAFSIPPMLGLAALSKKTPTGSPARNAQLAWFGGIALFFITLIFPIQFHREWITIGWALEGAALC